MKRYTAWLLACAAVAAFCCTVANAQEKQPSPDVKKSIDKSYSGKYVNHPGFKSLLKEIGGVCDKAMKKVEERLGLAWDGKYDITIAFSDDEGGDEHPQATTKSGYGLGRELTDEEKVNLTDKDLKIVITLFMEFVINGQTDVKTILAHEFIHALVRARRGSRYFPMRKWLSEGLAVWGSGELEERADKYIAAMLFDKKDPVSLINGLETEPHKFDDYIEDALLIEFIAKKFGKEKVKALVAELTKQGARFVISGKDDQKALEKVTGMSWEDLNEGAMAFSKDYIKAMVSTSGSSQYEKAAELYRKGKHDKAIASFESFIKKCPNSFLVPNALYLIGVCQFSGKNYKKAEETFQTLQEKFPRYGYLCDRAQYKLARCYAARRKQAKAIEAYETLLRDRPYAPKTVRADAHYWLGCSYKRKRDYAKALEEFKSAVDLGGSYDDDAMLMLGEAYYRTKDLAMARQTFEKFLEKYPSSRHRKTVERFLRKLKSAGK